VLLEINVPELAESVPDATLLEWSVKPGQFVEEGTPLIDLETDKVTLEISAPTDGVLSEIRKQTGDIVVPGDVLAMFDNEGQPPLDGDTPLNTYKEDSTSLHALEEEDAKSEQLFDGKSKKIAGPSARRLLEENNLNPSSIAGTGKGGRVTKQDVYSFLEDSETQTEETLKARKSAQEQSRAERRVPMTRLRKRTAEKLLYAQQSNAILSTFNEVNMEPIIQLRKRHEHNFFQRHKVKLGYMPFFVKATTEALKNFPLLNSSVEDDVIVYHEYFDVGVAVSTEKGLVVPILRDADKLSFSEIEKLISGFGEKAKTSALTLEELMGGTFTISNGGVFGSLLSTPIINPPQSAILGMHSIQERPIVENKNIVAKPMMYLALSYDHRIIDGRDAVQFLVSIKESIEDPTRLLLDI
jgi:2-oxoglutarate dehydrogenase E2 component (dihydrolipoamide succinyltransferase)